MGRFAYLLLFAWMLQDNLAIAQVPLLASSNICRFNPTQTTIALQKPYCFYVSTTALNTYLYVVRNDAPSTNLLPSNTFQSTNGGASAPYVAVNFSNPNCTNPPTTSQIYDLSQVQSTLDNYVVRVGNDPSCFNVNPCNAPLQSNTAYRFLYAFYDDKNNLVSRSDWSPPIYTQKAIDSASIDTWPGRRSGGMIVITSILSVLTFFILAGLVAAVITSLMSPSSSMEPTQHESRTSHTVTQKTEGGVEYASALSASERYSTHPQA